MFSEFDFASGILAAIGHCLMALALLTWLLLCPGCRPVPTPTPTATIAPSPTPPPSPTAETPLSFLDPEVRLYLDETEPFASTIALVQAMSLSVGQLDEVLNQLREIIPPPDLAEAHEQLIAAYDYLRQGMAILSSSPPPDNVLRAEGYFLQDWGLKCLRDHQEMVYQYIETQRQRLTPTPEADRRRITLAFGGDVMLGRLVNETILQRGPRYIWGDVLPLVQGADLALVNLECTIADSGEPFMPPRVFYFRADPRAIEALTLAGVDYVSLANNHALDFQSPALLETIRHLDEHGIAHAGAGANLAEASQPALLEAGGIKVGVVAFADHFREYGATVDTPGTRIITISTEEQHFREVRESIQAARGAGADLVVFSIHWGPNMRQVPSPEFVEFAHAVMDAGADIFHGHSAHLFQGIEVYNGKPILYDTGELIDDYYVDLQLRNDQQLLFLLTATSQGVERIELIPLLISYMQVNRATGDDFDEIAARIRSLSAAMGTEIEQEGDRLVIEVRE
jgi:poly-gamma-glutamate capsule biosynthesis protein CapA/YwtB (metallophosphatase superfamily)